MFLDRVKSIAVSCNGTADATFTAAAAQHALPPAGIDATVIYTLLDSNGTDWETGRATVAEAAGTYTIARSGAQTVTASSNSGAAVSFSTASTHTVFLTPDASFFAGVETLISTVSASSDTEIVVQLPDGLVDIRVAVEGVVPQTNGANLELQLSTDGGSTWLNSLDYEHRGDRYSSSGAAAAVSSSNADDLVPLPFNCGNGSGENVSGEVRVNNHESASVATGIQGDFAYLDATPNSMRMIASGQCIAPAKTNAVRFYFSSGNITSGTFKLYGRKASVPQVVTDGRLGSSILLGEENAAATTELVVPLPGDVEELTIELDEIVPATDNRILQMQFSTDGGSTWRAASGDYRYNMTYQSSSGSASGFDSVTNGYAELATSLGNQNGESASLRLDVRNNDNLSFKPMLWNYGCSRSFSPSAVLWYGSVSFNTDLRITHLRFYMSSGNITSMRARVLGRPKPSDLSLYMEKLNTQTYEFSDVSEMVVPIPAGFDKHILELSQIAVATDGVSVAFHLSTDGGSTYQTGQVYDFRHDRLRSDGTEQESSPTSPTKNTEVTIMTEVSNTAGDVGVGKLELYDLATNGVKPTFQWMTTAWATGGKMVNIRGGGGCTVTSPVTHIKVFADSGNLSGKIKVTGM